jgi:hypothetical protein
MMSRYRFELATPADDADLCAVLAATPMEGRIAVVFRREPSWFAGAVVDGRFRQVVACRDLRTGRIIGFGCRSIREVSLNGSPGVVGYLSGLRVLPEHRNLGLVARGFAFFRELHRDRRVPFYLTTIGVGNQTAETVLTSGRAGLPTYHPAGEYHTVVLPLPRRRRLASSCSGMTVRPARADDLPEVLDFLAATGPCRQFFPRLRADDFSNPQGLMRGLSLDWLLLARRNGRLIGTLAGWDQHDDRRSVVHSYGGWLSSTRPFYNTWALIRGLPHLPAPGEPLRYLMGALPAAMEDDQTVFAALLEAMRVRAAGGPWTHLLLGLHQSDPLLQAARRHQAACYVTRLFLVCWQDGDEALSALDDRVPYLEAGSL